MIPKRFATEYPERCLALLEAFEPTAHKADLLGTFSIMLASSILLVPWERANNKHPIVQEQGSPFQDALKQLKKRRWSDADFWQGAEPPRWRFSRIMGDPNDVAGWRDEGGRHSFSEEANTIDERTVDNVLRVLRNGLAHANIVYLDGQGHETAGNRVEYLAFLSRYEESPEQEGAPETYRVVVVGEGHFLQFVKAWAGWVARHHHHEENLRVA